LDNPFKQRIMHYHFDECIAKTAEQIRLSINKLMTREFEKNKEEKEESGISSKK